MRPFFIPMAKKIEKVLKMLETHECVIFWERQFVSNEKFTLVDWSYIEWKFCKIGYFYSFCSTSIFKDKKNPILIYKKVSPQSVHHFNSICCSHMSNFIKYINIFIIILIICCFHIKIIFFYHTRLNFIKLWMWKCTLS